MVSSKGRYMTSRNLEKKQYLQLPILIRSYGSSITRKQQIWDEGERLSPHLCDKTRRRKSDLNVSEVKAMDRILNSRIIKQEHLILSCTNDNYACNYRAHTIIYKI